MADKQIPKIERCACGSPVARLGDVLVCIYWLDDPLVRIDPAWLDTGWAHGAEN